MVFVSLEGLLVNENAHCDGVLGFLWSWLLLGEKDVCSAGGKLGEVV